MFFGYNFFYDNSALTPALPLLNSVNTLKIKNGMFKYVNIENQIETYIEDYDNTATYDKNNIVSYNDGTYTYLYLAIQDVPVGTALTNIDYWNLLPRQWNNNTLFICDFTNLNGGNANFTIENISKVLVKRRVVGEDEWITLAEVIIESSEDMLFTHHDYFNASDVQYEYALVNVDNSGNEQEYNEKVIDSIFNKVFLCDGHKSYDMTREFTIENSENVQESGIYNTYGRKYPIVVTNNNLNYEKMTISSILMVKLTQAQYNQMQTDYNNLSTLKANNLPDQQIRIQNAEQFDGIYTGESQILRKYQRDFQKEFLGFLLNKKSKILKDYNGNIWTVAIVESPSKSYIKELGNGLCSTSFEIIEIGDSDSESDLYDAGLIPIKPIHSNTL